MNKRNNMLNGTRKKLEKGKKRYDGRHWNYMKKRKTGELRHEEEVWELHV